MGDIERFQAGFDRGADSECWEWKRSRSAFGYGQIRFAGSNTNAHRVSYLVHNGPIVDGLWVLHRCDNPPCVNPGHLFLGTQADNVHDMLAKGRARPPAGDEHPQAALTSEQVAAIWHSEGRSTDIAAQHGVSPTTVRRIRRGAAWAKATGGPADYRRERALPVTPAVVEEIRRRRLAGETCSAIAIAVGVSRSVAWRHGRPT